MLKEYNGCQVYQSQCSSNCKVQQKNCCKNYYVDQNTEEDCDFNNVNQNDNIIDPNYHKNRGYRSNEREINKRNGMGDHLVSSHLMGLNKLMKRKVSPIHREDSNYLMNSGNSLFESSQSNHLTNRGHHKVYDSRIMEEESNFRTTEEAKDCYKELMSLSIEELSENKKSNDSEEDELHIDENIEMERIAKMNFYAFKSSNNKGIVGMCQDINKTRIKSPANDRLSHLSPNMNASMNNKYKSFMNKSISSCANLMVSNKLLKNKKSNINSDHKCMNMPFAKHQL